ncbi:type VI secretion system-associated protein [Rubrivivax gelatinosus]|uniref:Type VI secretion system-associated protein n=1 Tax=Rubrivivax gelatinosus TaxID=28068 RepID=A0ABS1DXS2_RUBGE|nr:type VI secretion system-associated protein [Rubrivivax gelatinosus]MBK1714338.1 type VI secretion system-associated protein [Rubrivivax gelatinosus]
MLPSSKVLWGEGLFLRPQHFQRQDAYHEWRLAEGMRTLHPYAWGVRKCRVDTDALASGVLRFAELQIVFPDGEMYAAPGEDDLPAPVSLATLPTGATEFVFHAAMAPMRSAGSNSARGDAPADASMRFRQAAQDAADWFTAAAGADVVLLKRVVRVVAEHEPREHLVSLPLLRLRRQAAGGFEHDGRFMPPCVALQASPMLMLMLRRLIEMLQAKVDALYGFHREPSKHVIEFRSGDIASFWLLHTASSACAALAHYQYNPALHPERLFERLLELAGALMTFSKSFTLAELPPYRHDAPGPAFLKLDTIVRELLETVISTRYFAIALAEARPSFHVGRLDSEQITPSTTLVLGVSAAMPAAELVDAVPLRLKVGGPDDVDKLVLSAMAGVRLVHTPQVPAAIPVRPGTYYFQFEARGPLYERMLQSQSVTIYVPSGIEDVRLELFALNA